MEVQNHVKRSFDFFIDESSSRSSARYRRNLRKLDNWGNRGHTAINASWYKLARTMSNLIMTTANNDHEAPPEEESGIAPILGSGFEDEQPETDFDERI